MHDMEYKEADVDVEVQMAVEGPCRDTEHVAFKTAPAVQVAAVTFRGAYDQISQVNEAVADWVGRSGWEFAGPAFNIYHVGPAQTQDPAEYLTEVCYPVVKKEG